MKRAVLIFLLGASAGASAASTSSFVTPIDAAQVRISPAKNGRVTIFARGKNAFFAKLEMDPGGKIPPHRDATEEYIHVLEGSGKMTIDGKEHAIAPGTSIYMAPNAEVSFQNGEKKLVAIQVFAGPEPAKKYDAWTAQ